ncbi:MAG: IS1/IS1595 family N-terminal zinc-binding domain-containing protein [Candidatus Bathyarchaeales archaeon]
MECVSQKVINCPYCGRVLPREFWHEKSQADKRIVKCPRCGSTRTWKDAKRHTSNGVIQRYYCRDCGRRFSERQRVVCGRKTVGASVY